MCGTSLVHSNAVIYIPVLGAFLIAAFDYASASKNNKDSNSSKIILVAFLVPQLVFYFYTIAIHVANPTLSYALGTNLSGFAPILLATTFVVVFKQKFFTAFIAAFLVSAAITAIVMVWNSNLDLIFESFVNIFVYLGSDPSGVTDNIFEVHDMTFAAGFLLLYAMAVPNIERHQRVFLVAVSLLLIMIGLKRIEIAALAVAVAVFVLTKIFAYSKILRFTLGFFAALMCMLFVFLVIDGSIYHVMGNINYMGRQHYWSTISQYATFDLFYQGLGRNSVSAMLLSDYAYLKVGGVHSDLLKIYVEQGFILFALWLVYYLLFLPQYLEKKYQSTNLASFFQVLMSYLFVLYVSDNVENYLVSQTMLILIIMAFAFKKKQYVTGCFAGSKPIYVTRRKSLT